MLGAARFRAEAELSNGDNFALALEVRHASRVEEAALGPLPDRYPQQASADSGYLSRANLQALTDRDIDVCIATGRAKHPTAETAKVGGPLTQTMRRKITDGGFYR